MTGLLHDEIFFICNSHIRIFFVLKFELPADWLKPDNLLSLREWINILK